MIRYDKLTIIRNRQRVRELVRFREVVERFFEKSEYVADDQPLDWEGARAARAQINRMLPRVIQIVSAGGLGSHSDGLGPKNAGIDAIRNIFDARDTVRAEEEILDLVDMATGVYQANRFSALWRTINPLHYTGVVLEFVLGLPRKGLTAMGVVGKSAATTPLLQAEYVTRLDAIATRLADGQDSIETRLVEMGNRQEQRLSENSDQLANLSERLEFAERMMTQLQKPAGAAGDEEVATPL